MSLLSCSKNSAVSWQVKSERFEGQPTAWEENLSKNTFTHRGFKKHPWQNGTGTYTSIVCCTHHQKFCLNCIFISVSMDVTNQISTQHIQMDIVFVTVYQGWADISEDPTRLGYSVQRVMRWCSVAMATYTNGGCLHYSKMWDADVFLIKRKCTYSTSPFTHQSSCYHPHTSN